ARVQRRGQECPRRGATNRERCGTPRRGLFGNWATTITVTTICTCTYTRMCTSMSRRSSHDAAALDHREVIAQLLGLSGIVPVEELLHATGDGGRGRVPVIS